MEKAYDFEIPQSLEEACHAQRTALIVYDMQVGIIKQLQDGDAITVRHGADLGYIPIVVKDACGAGHREAGERALASIEFIGDAMLTDMQSICKVLGDVASSGSGVVICKRW